jgi:hypothetical protein
MHKSITLIEIIFSLIILSIALLTSSNIILQLNKNNKTSKENLLLKIDFETTRLFLKYKIKEDENLSNVKYKDTILYYNKDILLQNVTKFKKSIISNIISINICINYNTEICQDISLNNEI